MTYAAEANKASTRRLTLKTLQKMKAEGEKFVTIALYDAPMAAQACDAGAEVLLVGDSLGMTVLGYDSTLPVTMEHMLYHVEAVARGNSGAIVMGDMPFMSYATPEQALENAAKLMRAGAHLVKLEGGEWLAETVRMLSERGIPVCAHLGLTPQSVNKFGGFLVQGRNEKDARRLLHDAKTLERAGADLVLLECVPTHVASAIAQEVHIPSIGIGAGTGTDAQVLVVNDILGLTPKPPKFSKNFLLETGSIGGALKKYVDDVKNGRFPDEEHSFK